MGLTKRIWIEKDPRYADFRKNEMDKVWARTEDFKFRAPLRRPSKGAYWPGSLERAVKQLKLEAYRVNGGMFFETEAARDAALSRTEEILSERSR